MTYPARFDAAAAELLLAEVERVENSARRDRLRAEIADLAAADATFARYCSPLGEVAIHRAGETLLPQVLDEAAYTAWARIHHPDRVFEVVADTGELVDVDVDGALLGELAAAGELHRWPEGLGVLVGADGLLVDGIGAVPSSFGLEITLAPEAKAAARLAGAGLDPSLAEMRAR